MKNYSFGDKVRHLRLNKGLTQDELAKKLGYKSNSVISFIENNEKFPSIEKIQDIATYFNVSIDFLLGNDISNVNDLQFQEYKKTTEHIMSLLEKYNLIKLDDFGKLENEEDFLKSLDLIEKIIEFKKSK